jgi:pimeloyl-ACP methyl ester carboxylesterase
VWSRGPSGSFALRDTSTVRTKRSPDQAAFCSRSTNDWGSALGFDWASQNPDRVAGIAFMESIVTPITWSEFPADARPLFGAAVAQFVKTLRSK